MPLLVSYDSAEESDQDAIDDPNTEDQSNTSSVNLSIPAHLASTSSGPGDDTAMVDQVSHVEVAVVSHLEDDTAMTGQVNHVRETHSSRMRHSTTVPADGSQRSLYPMSGAPTHFPLRPATWLTQAPVLHPQDNSRVGTISHFLVIG